MMEERLGKPCLGVVPYLPGLAHWKKKIALVSHP
jgi:cobyric acid synthase